MGNIILLNDGMYEYELPPIPDEKEIWYYDVPKKQQYWKTPANKNFKWLTPDNRIWNVDKMKERDKVEYIEYWRDKWLNGLWLMINGEPTYMTGGHVEHLVFNMFKNGFFMYLDAQKERFYFRDLVNKEKKCDGGIFIKCRRAGITAEQITQSIRVLLSDYSNNVALQSDTHLKAKSTLLSKIIETYVKRPKWMREDFYSSNGKIPREKLELTTSQLVDEENYPLGGQVRSFPTTSKALDGEEFMDLTMDELSKWEEADPYETYEINKKTTVNPGKRGACWLLSTSGDSRSVVKATISWHKLIADSNPKILNANGKTNTGLWKYFISGIHSMELVEQLPEVLDIYGKVNREMAEEYIWRDVNKHPKNSKEYIYALYKMPIEERHALLTVTSNTYFSKVRITDRLDHLRNLPNDSKPYVRGRFEFTQSGNVVFEPDEYGHWLIALHPFFSVERNVDTRNRFRKSDGVFFPPNNPEFGIGYDPIRYKKEDTSSASLSKACIVVAKKHDYYNSGESNQYAALYLHRPDDPVDGHKECAKACKYFGAPCMHERTIESVKSTFEDLHMLPFLQKNEKDNLYGMWIDSQGKVVKNALESMVTKFASPKEDIDVDQISIMPFEECLTDMDSFDIANTTKFDVFMAMVELEYSLKQLSFTNVTDNSQNNLQKYIQEIIPSRRH